MQRRARDRSARGRAGRISNPVADTHTLSEADSAQLVARHGVPIAESRRVGSADEAVAAAEQVGYPVVVKLNGARIAHKTERGLVRVGLTDSAAVRDACEAVLAAARPDDGDVDVLVAHMVNGSRELIAGLHTDPQFGSCVMVGIGGILTEAVADVAFRLAPLDPVDAADMLDDLRSQALLGPLRGEPAVDRAALVDILLALSRVAGSEPDVVAVDLYPLVVDDGAPIAVDALVEVT